MKKNIVRNLVTFLLVALINVPVYMLWVPELGGITAFVLLLIFDILLYWHADKRYYGFLHAILMTGAVLGTVWLAIFDFHILFREYHPVLSEILWMFLLALVTGGLWFLGMHYLILQKEGES